MIIATELRIGNKFQSPFGVETVFEILDNTDRGRVLQKGYEHIIIPKENRNQYKLIEIKPIQLTPELLKKCLNFEEGTYTTKGLRGYFVALVLDGKVYAEYYLGPYSVCKVEFLHQLQNLVFALAGQELKINKPLNP